MAPGDVVDVVLPGEPQCNLVISAFGSAMVIGIAGVVGQGDPEPAGIALRQPRRGFIPHAESIATTRKADIPSSAPTISRLCARAASWRPLSSRPPDAHTAKRTPSTMTPPKK